MSILLDENAVVDAVAAYLSGRGYEIVQALHGHQRGVDVIARRLAAPAQLVYIEAKGGTSSRAGSPKHGKPMSGGEVRINIAEALYTAAIAATRTRTPKADGLVSAVAFQDDALHRKYADPLRPAFDHLGIGVFWVAAGSAVMLESPWSLY